MSSDFLYVISLDGVVTRDALLPGVAAALNRQTETADLLRALTDVATPFADTLHRLVAHLRDVSADRIAEICAAAPLHEEVVGFIRERRDRCRLVTSLPDAWVAALAVRIGSPIAASAAVVEAGRVVRLRQVIRKADSLSGDTRAVAVGHAADDAEMIDAAAIGIGFAGGSPPLSCPLDACTHAIYDEGRLCRFLRQL